MTIKYMFHQIGKRLRIHWRMIVKGIVYATLTVMLWEDRMTVEQWIAAAGSVMTLDSILSKDTSKLQTKEKFQVKDPE